MEDNIISLKFQDVEIPDFKERIGEKYVRFGAKDDYPDFLISLLNKSAKHGSIVKNKATYIFGGGVTDTENPTLQAFNTKNNKLFKRIIYDIEAFGMCYVECIPTRDKKSFGFHHLSYKNMRTNSSRTSFFYAKNRKVFNPTEIEMPAFNPAIKVRSCFMFSEYNPVVEVYGLPGYIRCMNWIVADVEVSKHTLSNAKTGFSPSKFLNFFNGEPDEATKRSIEAKLKNKFGGSSGDKMIIGFNNAATKEPTVQDLGASDLTKEDFSQVDELIKTNIYAGHEITNPALFGVPSSNHHLGGNAGAELKMAYDIFKSTYVANKKLQAEEIFNYLAAACGLTEEITLVDIEPVGYTFTEATLLAVAPRSWLLEKLGIDTSKYTDAPAESATAAPAAPTTQSETMVNDNVKNLTAKQHQQLLRIIRQYTKEQITREVATILLKTGLGFSDEEITGILGTDTTADQFGSDEDVAGLFSAHGENRETFDVFDKKKAMSFSDETAIQKKIVDAIKENPTATATTIAAAVGVSVEVVKKYKDAANGKGIIKALPKFEVRYSYEKRPDVTGADVLPTTRPFCRKMLSLNKLYSRQDIQKISQYLGYDVMRRAGGFWNNDGTVEYHCRHEFFSQIVMKK